MKIRGSIVSDTVFTFTNIRYILRVTVFFIRILVTIIRLVKVWYSVTKAWGVLFVVNSLIFSNARRRSLLNNIGDRVVDQKNGFSLVTNIVTRSYILLKLRAVSFIRDCYIDLTPLSLLNREVWNSSIDQLLGSKFVLI